LWKKFQAFLPEKEPVPQLDFRNPRPARPAGGLKSRSLKLAY